MVQLLKVHLQIGNTEILTQYSDILGSINSYTYKGTEVGYTAQTSSTGADVQRLTKETRRFY